MPSITHHAANACLLLLALSPSLFANPIALVNEYRTATGMIPLNYSSELSQSSYNHALYLEQQGKENIKTFEQAHNEKAHRPGFTGESVADRALAAGYPHHSTVENISIGSRSDKESIDLLMSGIYHRFGFLHFKLDQIGYAQSDDIHVYNMGRYDFVQTCQSPPQSALISAAHDCVGTPVTETFWQQLCRTLPEQAIFKQPFKQACPNGVLFKQSYMDNVCQRPPAHAKFSGHGSYYELCEPAIKLKAEWLDQLCVSPPQSAVYQGDGRYFKICDQKVHGYWLEQRCSELDEQDKYKDSGRYFKLCADENVEIRTEYVDELDETLMQRNPAYVLWPYPNSTDMDTTFYGEIPDPLPDLEISGYPLSIQFNPAKVKTARIKHFSLQYQANNGTWADVPYRFLNQQNDPNSKMSALEFAWFPLKPLQASTDYFVDATVIIDEQEQNISWQFQTKSRFF